jgi:hypothetical protein
LINLLIVAMMIVAVAVVAVVVVAVVVVTTAVVVVVVIRAAVVVKVPSTCQTQRLSLPWVHKLAIILLSFFLSHKYEKKNIYI